MTSHDILLRSHVKEKIDIQSVLMLDQHPLICDGLKNIVFELLGNVVIKSVTSLNEIVISKPDLKPHILVFIDIFSIGSSALDELISFRVSNQDVKIIICSDTNDTCLINWCLSLGVSGFISKNAAVEDIKLAIKNIVSGHRQPNVGDHVWTPRYLKAYKQNEMVIEPCKFPLVNLTSKEIATLKYLTSGMSNRTIAEKLGVAESTTKSHVASILHKMDVLNRTEAVSEYHRACRMLDLQPEDALAECVV